MSYQMKVGKKLFVLFCGLSYVALNIASNGALFEATKRMVYVALSAILPLVPFEQMTSIF